MLFGAELGQEEGGEGQDKAWGRNNIDIPGWSEF
jgi:hypothetical protein